MARRAHPDAAFVDELCLRLRSLGYVSARAMFGGHGLYLHGSMFALIADGEAYFKTDAQNLAEFAALEARPFVYQGKGKPVQMSYQALPAEVFEEDEHLLRVARLAIDAALRAQLKRQR